MAGVGERDENGAHRGSGREAEQGESTYAGEAGRRERSTPGRPASRLMPDEEERRGQMLQGAPNVRDEAIPGPRDSVAERTGGGRTNPPQVEGAGMGDGGLSQSGGVGGGARGNAGRSDGGAGGPTGDMRAGPGEHASTARGDLDHGTTDER